MSPTRITKRFEELRRSGELGLVAYITAGDPSLAASERIALALAESGADVHVAIPHFKSLFQPGSKGHSRRLHLC